ncbi:MAG: MFS transporter [Chitinophagaceae bacterium]
MKQSKPLLSFWQIINMNVGFFGLQYSFGLQQANMSPIYSYLGAEESKLPYLWLAGPITGLLIQPIVGAMSDKTISRWGRRKPYFFIGAIICSICLFIMPYSSSVLMAACILWILDAANNITQEPYRAFVSDKLNEQQYSWGFLTQSAFTGLGQTVAYLTPTLLILLGVSKSAQNQNNIPLTTLIAFIIGGVVSIGSILYSLITTKEIPLTAEQLTEIKASKTSLVSGFGDIKKALLNMPPIMKQMIPMMFFSWYAMFIYWIYITKCLSKSLFHTVDVHNAGFRNAELLTGQIGAFYNFIAFFGAFLLAALAKKWNPKLIHGACLFIAGLGLLILPHVGSVVGTYLAIIGLGFCWASMMGNPYVMLAANIPPEKTGIYMGIFNMFIVIPMLLQNLTMPLYYNSWLNGNPVNAIMLAGILLILASLSTKFIQLKSK